MLSYLGLFYIVHLEALKLGMQPMINRAPRPVRERLVRWGLGLAGSTVVVWRDLLRARGRQALAGRRGGLGHRRLDGRAVRCSAVKQAADEPDLPQDIDVDDPKPLDTWSTVQGGLHFLLPVGTLIWALMVEELSPALSAFWAIVVLIVLMATPARADRLLPRRPRQGRAAGARRLPRRRARPERRRAQHDRHRRRHRHRRHHRRRHHAHRPGPAHDRVRRVRQRRQRDRDAALHRLRLPGARPGRADDRQLRAGGHADGAGGGRARRAERHGHPADRGAPVRLLLRDHGRHHAAGRAGDLRRRGDLAAKTRSPPASRARSTRCAP